MDLTPRLNDVIDPDALDSLFSQASGRTDDLEVTFSYAGFHVQVSGDGEIVIAERDRRFDRVDTA